MKGHIGNKTSDKMCEMKRQLYITQLEWWIMNHAQESLKYSILYTLSGEKDRWNKIS